MTCQYFRIEDRGEERIIYCECEELVNDLTVKNVGRELSKLCEAALDDDKKGIILDLGAVRSMAPAMLVQLLYPAERFLKQGREFRICNVSPFVEDLFVRTEAALLINVTRPDGTVVKEVPCEPLDNEIPFTPEQARNRRKAFEALEAAGFRWLENYKTLDLHDVRGIEVCGICHEHDAHAILQLLAELHPAWHRDPPEYEPDAEWGWHVALRPDPVGNKP